MVRNYMYQKEERGRDTELAKPGFYLGGRGRGNLFLPLEALSKISFMTKTRGGEVGGREIHKGGETKILIWA